LSREAKLVLITINARYSKVADGRSQPPETAYHRGCEVEALAMTTDVVRSVLVSRDPGILGGDAAFKGTRVPVVSLVDWLEGGYSLMEVVMRIVVFAAMMFVREGILQH
jgi:hypothetical protein